MTAPLDLLDRAGEEDPFDLDLRLTTTDPLWNCNSGLSTTHWNNCTSRQGTCVATCVATNAVSCRGTCYYSCGSPTRAPCAC